MSSGKRLYAKVKQTSKFLTGIAHPTRQAIVDILLGGPLSATQIVLRLKISPTLASHHIQEMVKSEWLMRRKVGRHVFYRINPLTMRKAYYYFKKASELLR